jgi:hypothetical protein
MRGRAVSCIVRGDERGEEMGSKNKCRDCSKCTERGITKLIKKTANAGLIVGTLGTSVAGAQAIKGVRQNCPICTHPISRHEIIDGRFKD